MAHSCQRSRYQPNNLLEVNIMKANWHRIGFQRSGHSSKRARVIPIKGKYILLNSCPSISGVWDSSSGSRMKNVCGMS